MRNDGFDRSAAERRRGLRRAAIAAWTVVVVLFAIVYAMPGAPAHQATPDHAIARLVAHSVQPAGDSCYCDDFDHLAMAPSPSLC
ncbi:MAG: hypothetical protein JWO51_5351 [Rhodospirillales bacterium]|nr:hypothetical protein [Rhodospirillales bacterium]